MVLSNHIKLLISVSCFLALLLCSCGSSGKSSEGYVFKVADEFEMPSVDRAGIYTFEQAYTPEEKFDDFLKQYVDEDTIKKGEKLYITGSPNGIMWEYEEKVGDIAYNGYFIYDEMPSADESEEEKDVTDRYYYVNEFDKIKIVLDEKETTLAKLSNDAEDRLVKAAKTLGCDIKLKPLLALVNYSGDDVYQADIRFCIDNGDGSGITVFHDLQKESEKDSPYFVFSALYRSLDITPLLRNYRGIILTKDFEERSDYISCQEAMQKASDKLASEIDLTLHYAQLEYRPVLKEYDKTVWTDNEDFDYQYGAIYTSEPYWALYFDVKDNFQRIVYVNAISGEVELLFNNHG